MFSQLASARLETRCLFVVQTSEMFAPWIKLVHISITNIYVVTFGLFHTI